MNRSSANRNDFSARFQKTRVSSDKAFHSEERPSTSSLLVPEALRQAFDCLCPDDYMLFEDIVLIHAPGTRFPTSKIDYLAVTPFGVFEILTMNFRGNVRRGPDAETVKVLDEEGEVVLRTSPVRRQAATLRCLRALLLPQACPVEALAVPGSLPCLLDPLLPESIMDVSELFHYLRVRMMRFLSSERGPVDLNRAVEAIATRVDARFEALDEHYARMISVTPF
jgi:Nuclease-related domain